MADGGYTTALIGAAAALGGVVANQVYNWFSDNRKHKREVEAEERKHKREVEAEERKYQREVQEKRKLAERDSLKYIMEWLASLSTAVDKAGVFLDTTRITGSITGDLSSKYDAIFKELAVLSPISSAFLPQELSKQLYSLIQPLDTVSQIDIERDGLSVIDSHIHQLQTITDKLPDMMMNLQDLYRETYD